MAPKTCPSCYEKYTNISNHWLQSDCEFPDLGFEKYETVKGLLMSDAWLLRQGNNNGLALENTSREFIEHLQDKFGILTNKMGVSASAEENNKNLASQFGGKPQDYDADKIYNLTFVSHPTFNEFESWYTENGKRWPDDLFLSPTALKYWYAGDGNLYKAPDKRPIAEIACSNEIDREDYITELFSDFPVEPSFAGHKIRFGVDDTEVFLEIVGEPVPGFEYKWDA